MAGAATELGGQMDETFLRPDVGVVGDLLSSVGAGITERQALPAH